MRFGHLEFLGSCDLGAISVQPRTAKQGHRRFAGLLGMGCRRIQAGARPRVRSVLCRSVPEAREGHHGVTNAPLTHFLLDSSYLLE